MNWKRILSEKYKITITGTLLLASVLALAIPYKTNSTLLKPKIPVFITSATNGIHPFMLITATSNAERERGLMFVGTLPSDQGMIFIFPEEAQQTFWMYNTFIPLDIIFIDNNNKVVHIASNVSPHQTSPMVYSGDRAKYVIEINGGMAEKFGINLNSHIIFGAK